MATEPIFYVGTDEAPDKYRLKRQVGSGGEAQLWEAELDVEGTWEPVALKILRPDHFADLDRWKDRWSAQAEVLRFIRHPGVVGVREHFEGGGMHYAGEAPPGPRALYLVMNWHVGETLRDWSQQHRAAADSYEALRYLAQIGDVLDWLHSGQATPSGRAVIHADVTANNVLVTPMGQAVLVDFGLVRLAAGLSPVAEGTAGYLAPEVLALGAYSPASDRYAFGALTYFVLTGAPAPATLPEIRAGLAQAPAVIGQPAVLEHLMQMFTPEPAGRPACGEWIRYFRVTGATSADLSGATYTRPVEPGMAPPPTMPMAVSPPTAVMPVTPPPARPSSDAPAAARPPVKKKGKLIWVAVAIIGVLLGAGIAFAATRDSGSKGASAATNTSTTGASSGTTATSTSPSTVVESTSAVARSTTIAAATTTSSAASSATVRPTTTVAAATTAATFPPTTAASLSKPIPNEAYVSAAGFVVGQVRVRTAVITAPFCTIFASQSKAEFSLDINVAPRTRRMTGRIIFADDTLPVEATGFIKVLIDSSAINQGVVSFASPYILDLDVTDKSRVTIRVSIPEGSQATLNRATFVLVEGEFAT